MNFKQSAPILLLFALLGFAISCSDSAAEETGSGTLSVKLTDAPFPSDRVAEANVTITRIEIRSVEEQEGSFITLSEEEVSYNLLDLTNGVTATLVSLEIPVGSYDQVRLYVSEASIVLNDGSDYNLMVPGGAASGIKINIDNAIEVAGGLTTELLLDFDVSRSFVARGNPNDPQNGFIFKPVIKAANLSTAGRLVGMVTDSTSTLLDGAVVSVFAADTLNTSALTDDTGGYVVLGLEAGLYDVVVEYADYQADTTSAIEIVAANATQLDVQLDE